MNCRASPNSCKPGASAIPPRLPFYDAVPPLTPIRADEDRVSRITVCTRPFRAQGPRIEAETIGDKLVVHNYGHGGSGWSLSWGSGEVALNLALAGRDPSQTDVAVIGCGALGLTSAVLAQRAGARSVTIYAKDRPADTRSFRATGAWTPDSRIALTKDMPAAFPAQWESMARTSWRTYQTYLGLPGNPIEFYDLYALSDEPPPQALIRQHQEDPIGFAYLNERLAGLGPAFQDLPPGSHPFPTQHARRTTTLKFNVTAYAHQLMEDFQLNGGKIVHRQFHSPAEFTQLTQPVILHSTGYAARALFNDQSITPVRGQIGWLIPQTGVDYGIYWRQLNLLGRRDGIVIQLSQQGEASGWDRTDEVADHSEALQGVRILQDLYARMALKAASSF